MTPYYISLPLLICACYGVKIPDRNACPDYVEFKNFGDTAVILISVKNDYSGLYNMKVVTSLPFVYDKKNGTKLEIKDIKKFNEGDVPEVIFTFTQEGVKEFPRILSVVFNGGTICKAGPYPDDVTVSTTTYRLKAPYQIRFGKKTRSKRQSDELKVIPRNQCGTIEENKIGYPWLGVLFAYKIEAKNYEYICTVTLISDKHAITAASCLQSQNTLNYEADNLITVFRKAKMDNWLQNSVLAYVEKITIHPRLLKSKVGPDLAVLTLTDTIYISNLIQPICLEDPNEIIEGNSGTISGWDKSLNQIKNTTPFMVNMDKLSKEECTKLEDKLSEDIYCAGSQDSKELCVRNLGIPYAATSNETFYLKGIGTYSTSQKSCGNYTVFTDVTKEFNWIDSVLISP